MANVYAVVPAAGESRRMGTQKLLLPFAGTTVIGHVVRRLLAAPVRGVVVVVAPEAASVRQAAEAAGATTAVNPDPESDMLGSLRRGLRALPADADAALVALGDQPTVRPEVVGAMVAASGGRRDAIVVPTHGGRRGHPLLVGRAWFDEVLTRHDGVGLRGLLAAHADRVVEIPVPDARVLDDMDDPAAYRALADSQEA